MGFSDDLLSQIRSKFAHVDTCPFEGERVFFENAGGALTLKSVVETSAKFAAIPDNQGRDNDASRAMGEVIAKARADMRVVMNAPDGQIIVGESGTDMLFRMIRAAALAAPAGSEILGSTLEHPASRSAAGHWAAHLGLRHILVAHDDTSGTVGVDEYVAGLSSKTRVATIVHCSPVTGMSVDVREIAAAIRAVSPECLIIVDGIQHAAHGSIDIREMGVDGYAISPYKMFSRHGYGLAWVSDRLTSAPHDNIVGGPQTAWELGTRDAGAYATLSDVADYFDWLGSQHSDSTDRRQRIEAAGRAIREQEAALVDAMLYGVGNQRGLTEFPGIHIVGGAENPSREGLVSIWHDHVSSADMVEGLRQRNIRVHIRKNDHYSGNILAPLGRADCVRVSMCHYNSVAEVTRFLRAMAEISEDSQAR